MLLRKLILLLLMITFIFGAASDTFADISDAAVLFLRIAPGSRPAGMGDAFVAIADDATATHWNPAGLGAYPMADSWNEVKIPSNLWNDIVKSAESDDSTVTAEVERAVLKSFTSLETGSGSDYMAYDLWVLTSKGLARYDNKRWHFEEIFDTKTNQTLENIIISYFGISNETRIAEMSKRVARINSKYSFETVQALRDTIISKVPEDYSMFQSLKDQFDTLIVSYDACLINWERYQKIENEFINGMKDSVLNENELDKINFAVEKSKNRFLPEELKVPYSIIFSSEPNIVASTKKMLAFGTDEGLVTFDSRRWKIYTTESNLPSNKITSLCPLEGRILVGTDKGISVLTKLGLTSIADSTVIPNGVISAIAANSLTNIWAVIDDDLYHYDGNYWSNSHDYTVVVDDTREKVADRLTLYGSDKEKSEFINKLEKVNLDYQAMIQTAAPVVEEIKVENSDTTMVDTIAATETIVKEETASNEKFDLNNAFTPGNVIRAPYLVGLKGKVNSIQIDQKNRLWVGTEFGIAMFDGHKWSLPGYKDHVVEAGQSLADIVSMKTSKNESDKANYMKSLQALNDLSSENLSEGAILKVYRNPAAVYVNDISVSGGLIYFATAEGLIEFDGEWRRVGLNGLENVSVVDISSIDDEIWFASNEKIVIKANGRTEFALMHVNWLPELASDMYYEFFSVVTNKEGWGTFGGNVSFITYGSISRTGETGIDLGSFEAFDIAGTISYGTSLTNKLYGGVSTKIIYSRLAEQGAGTEVGKGTSTAMAVDFGFLYKWTPRLTLGMAITNIGPEMSYIDAAQSDPLPTNFSLGFAYKLLTSDYYQLLVTMETNKMLVGLDDGFDEFKPRNGMILNGGAEFMYGNILALRGGYIYDQEGQIETVTLGFGLKPIDMLKIDFAYIPSNKDVVLANTLRMSISILP